MVYENEAVNNEDTGLLDDDQLYEKESGFIYFVLLATSCATFTFGYSLGFTSPLFDPQDWSSPPPGVNMSTYPSDVHDKFMDVQMQLNDGERTWFGSIVNLGAGFGAVLAGNPVDRFGKRAGIISANLIFAIGYVIILTTPTVVRKFSDYTWEEIENNSWSAGSRVAQLLVARLVLGVGIGLTCCSVGNYQVLKEKRCT